MNDGMRIVQVIDDTMREKAAGALSVNVAQGEDGTAVLCLECVDKRGKPVGYFTVWDSQARLRTRLQSWRALWGKPLNVDMAPMGNLPESAVHVGVTNKA